MPYKSEKQQEKYFEKGGRLMTHDKWGNEEVADMSKLKTYDQYIHNPYT